VALARHEQVLRRMGLVPEAEADELEALGERVAVAAAAGVEADAEMGEVPDEFTVSAAAYDGTADSPPSAELSLARLPASCSQGSACISYLWPRCCSLS